MARRYRRTRSYTRRLKTVKYSNETRAMAFELPLDQSCYKVPMVSEVNTQGMRKCKNFTLNVGANTVLNDTTVEQYATQILFALVYVPQGTSPSDIGWGYRSVDPATHAVTWTNVSLYEPNQNVIMSGVISCGEPAKTFYSRLARNLNSGDSIVLVVKSPQNSAAVVRTAITCSLNYAMSY